MKKTPTPLPFDEKVFSTNVKQYFDTYDVKSCKWILPLLYYLSFGKKKPCEIRNDIPDINGRSLKRILGNMVHKELILRTVINDDPTDVEYSLLPGGKVHVPSFEAEADLGKKYRDIIVKSGNTKKTKP